MTIFTVKNLLSSYPPPIVGMADRLIQLIHQVAPAVKEKANRGWRSISYRDDQVGYFCGIFPFEDHADLVFEFGSLLDDQDGILLGITRQTRYLRFHELTDIHSDTVIYFLQAALDLPASHSVRKGLLQSRNISGSGNTED